ncbi:polyprenyl synthetase family protein, partial [Streptomyces sp. NPDC059851]
VRAPRAGADVRPCNPTHPGAGAGPPPTAAGDLAALRALDASLGRADLTEGGLDRVREILTATGTRDLVRERTERLARRALSHLAAARLAPGPAAVLRALLAETAGPPGPCPDPGGAPPGAPAPAPTATEAGR